MMKMLNREEDTRRAQKGPTHKTYIPTKIIGIKGDIEAFVKKRYKILDVYFQLRKRRKRLSKMYCRL